MMGTEAEKEEAARAAYQAACRTLDRRLRNGRAGPVFAGFLGNSPGYFPAKPSKTDLGGVISRYRRPKSDRLLAIDNINANAAPVRTSRYPIGLPAFRPDRLPDILALAISPATGQHFRRVRIRPFFSGRSPFR
ncbi:MAG: hypothetical protein Q8M09_14105 [Pseudomonadota bacterium]|nr:hypothetical protein [Pseudomonadota bacterium]MDP1905359.1 hypothetical protein [Pseudomonadota bacterium]MDP2354185.1 hypothetical protein [Pseudomonadota bacterium]